jgi:cytochrome c oxidase subunit 3
MSSERPVRVAGDLSGLPDGAMGPANVVWWGNLGFMLIEGTAFALAIGAYLYLQSRSVSWPPTGDRLPDLLWAGIFTVVLCASELPNLWVWRETRRKNASAVRVGTLAMALIGLALVGIRFVELDHLNVRWDQDAYGSVVWMLMILHTSHLITDLGDTIVQSVWLYTHRIDTDQFSDVEDNSAYWTFVVISWLPIYLLLYWIPRLT